MRLVLLRVTQRVSRFSSKSICLNQSVLPLLSQHGAAQQYLVPLARDSMDSSCLFTDEIWLLAE
jgi:hypothetical protein